MKLTRREVEIFSRWETLFFPFVGIICYGGGIVSVLMKRGLREIWMDSPGMTIVFLVWGIAVTLFSLFFVHVFFVARRIAKQNSNGTTSGN